MLDASFDSELRFFAVYWLAYGAMWPRRVLQQRKCEHESNNDYTSVEMGVDHSHL